MEDNKYCIKQQFLEKCYFKKFQLINVIYETNRYKILLIIIN